MDEETADVSMSFVKAIKIQREFYRGYGLDIFTDGVSLPGLAEKISYQTLHEDLNYPNSTPSIKQSNPSNY